MPSFSLFERNNSVTHQRIFLNLDPTISTITGPTCSPEFFCHVAMCKTGKEGYSFSSRCMPDQMQKNRPVSPVGGGGGGEGPSAPKVDKPNTEELLKRMRKVDPDQARRYRQRTGQ
jgi:hypothetical protein